MHLAPSLGMLDSAAPETLHRNSILLIGNPEKAVDEYPKLPYAAREIELIGNTFPADRKLVIQGAQADPSSYRDASPGRFGWIHFAAHATANRANPLDSSLILSRGPSGYMLSAREVMEVPLHARLVTLSACRSAGARTYSGEGQVGLSWAFLRAGAQSVVAGLWDVTDRSTSSLMADFYDQIANGAAPPEALRHAKLLLLKGSYPKPFYWGPFQLYAGTMQ
jgi:CHAT domain-containing protein